ncbi:MAG TPA: CHAT domain-containing protein, partial [Gemmatimonadales bacterium]|nr:CHAT domain-containing protein [Gemmatimonadales bacterium]
QNVQRLIVVPHRELYYLPFGALLRPGSPDRFLIERYDVAYAPSASVLSQLRARFPAPDSAAGTVLALAPEPVRLPGSRTEVDAIRRFYGARATVLLGAAASETAFRAEAADADIVHLSTFGVLNRHNPLFSFIALRAGGGEDGRLEVHEAFGLPLRARLVVLSACQTGLGSGVLEDVPEGDDWVGLVQAFLTAGAGSVAASLWPVADRPTATLMTEFYRRLRAGDQATAALSGAQRAALQDPATADPFFWAGFEVVGGS